MGIYVKTVETVKSKELKTTCGGNPHISATDRKGGTNGNLSRLRAIMQHQLYGFVYTVGVIVSRECDFKTCCLVVGERGWIQVDSSWALASLEGLLSILGSPY